MKVSELIATLAAHISVYGDTDVQVWDCYDDCPADQITVRAGHNGICEIG